MMCPWLCCTLFIYICNVLRTELVTLYEWMNSEGQRHTYTNNAHEASATLAVILNIPLYDTKQALLHLGDANMTLIGSVKPHEKAT